MPQNGSLAAAQAATSADVLAIGLGPGASMSMTYTASSSAFLTVMQSAGAAQRSTQQITIACVATTCAYILKAAAAPA